MADAPNLIDIKVASRKRIGNS